MENIQNQLVNLLARKAVLLEELKGLEARLGQLTAVVQYLNDTAAQAEAAPE